MQEEIVKFNLRIPKNLYEEIGKRAGLNRRSINNEIVCWLEEHLMTKGNVMEKDWKIFDKIYWINFCTRNGLDPSKPIPPDFYSDKPDPDQKAPETAKKAKK
jgi:hypothetical protein